MLAFDTLSRGTTAERAIIAGASPSAGGFACESMLLARACRDRMRSATGWLSAPATTQPAPQQMPAAERAPRRSRSGARPCPVRRWRPKPGRAMVPRGGCGGGSAIEATRVSWSSLTARPPRMADAGRVAARGIEDRADQAQEADVLGRDVGQRGGLGIGAAHAAEAREAATHRLIQAGAAMTAVQLLRRRVAAPPRERATSPR